MDNISFIIRYKQIFGENFWSEFIKMNEMINLLLDLFFKYAFVNFNNKLILNLNTYQNNYLRYCSN